MINSRFTTEFGKEIYILNFSHENPDESIPLIEECALQVRQRPENSVVTLTIVSSGYYNAELVDRLKKLSKGNSPYVRKAAVVGIKGLYKVAFTAVSIFSKREFKLFDTKEKALDYLLQD